ncbi:MAG TPA: C-GCAxxG-C-C family protein [Pseudoflavonifractor sp.]|nr:C-GCAxxG-C-C family protein [Pseudoflavonifractor sp.]
MDKIDRAQALRDDQRGHYNCCQAVLAPFAGECGLDEETALRLGAHFGTGMRHGATCGAVTGGLMVLGLLGKGEAESRRFLKAFQEEKGCLTCAGLLQKGRDEGVPRKTGCDGNVRGAVALIEEILKD